MGIHTLRKLLGESYGGPSLSFESGEYVLYVWYDAPPSVEVLGKGKTIGELEKSATKNVEWWRKREEW